MADYPIRVPLAPPGEDPGVAFRAGRAAGSAIASAPGDAFPALRAIWGALPSGDEFSHGLGNFLAGLTGGNPTKSDTTAAVAPAGKAQAAATPAAAATTAAAKAQALDPRTELNMNLARAVNQSLKSGFTLAGLNGLDRVLPIASAPARATPGKDVAAYQAMSIGNALYGQDMARAQALRAQGDTAGAAEVENSAAKAALELYKTIYSGGNTLPDAIAQQIAQAQGG